MCVCIISSFSYMQLPRIHFYSLIFCQHLQHHHHCRRQPQPKPPPPPPSSFLFRNENLKISVLLCTRRGTNIKTFHLLAFLIFLSVIILIFLLLARWERRCDDLASNSFAWESVMPTMLQMRINWVVRLGTDWSGFRVRKVLVGCSCSLSRPP